jgi:hypothetical protein
VQGSNLDRRKVAAIWAAAFMILIVAIAFLLKHSEIDLSITYAVIVAAPILIYLVLSGDVSEISGPGGLVAKFRADARAPVDTSAEIEALEFVAKTADPLQRSRQFRPGAPIALTLRLGDPTSGYDQNAIKRYLDALLEIDPEVTVIFNSTDGIFKASTDGVAIRSIVSNDHYGRELENAIMTANIQAMKALVAISENAVDKADSNGTALKKMIDAGVRSLVAVDQNGRAVGVVRRDRIVAKLVASLASDVGKP